MKTNNFFLYTIFASLGEKRSVSDPDSTFDFLNPKPIGQDLEKIGGYDHNFCLAESQEYSAQ